METPPPPLRARKKDATRHALIVAANRRFRQLGYESTTIDEICADAGIGRRTFFRYFANKEALAFPHRQERLERFQDLLLNAPADESMFTTLRRIARLFAREYMANREQLIAQQRLIHSAPTLLARENEIDRDWEAAIAHAFRERGGPGPASELRARVVAGATIGVIRATMRHWFECDGKPDLARLGDEALDCLERGFLPGQQEAGTGNRERGTATDGAP